MWKIALGVLIGLGATAAISQVVSNPQPLALTCAYNTSIPTPTVGQFFYVQCDSSGRIIIQ